MIRNFKTQGRPNASILITFLTFMVMTTTLMVLFLKSVAQSKRNYRMMVYREQSRRLLDSGRERALYRLANDAKFTSENWKFALDPAGNEVAQIDIRIANAEDPGRSRSIVVGVRYPLGSQTANRIEKQFPINP